MSETRKTDLLFITSHALISPLLHGCDHFDVVSENGTLSFDVTICKVLSFPGWLKFLLNARKILAVILRLKHDEIIDKDEDFTLTELPKLPNGKLGAFFVRKYIADEIYILESAEDRHLSAFLIIARQQDDNFSSRYYLVTIVNYKHWTGRLYFNIIRPFHHFIVWRMIKRCNT